MRDRLRSTRAFSATGYGHAHRRGRRGDARSPASTPGSTLDPTYTAKAFACALWHVRARQARDVLYWHTLSSAPMAPLLEGAPPLEALDPALRRLAVMASGALA